MKKIIFKIRWIKKTKLNCYTEFGINSSANKYILGISSEVENEKTGEDIARIPGFIKMRPKEVYIRIWLFKFCFSIGIGEICLEKKEKNRFKILFGIAGYRKLILNGEKTMDKKEMKINFCISNKCFLNCKGCYNRFSCDKDVDKKTLCEFLKFARINGVNKLTFSGGDPFAKNDFLKILKYALKIGYIVNIDTVGTPLIKNAKIINEDGLVKQIKKLSILKKVNMLGIPIDGSSNNIIQTFRTGRENLLEEQIEIIKKLSKTNVNICINTVLHKQNIKDIENLCQLISGLPNVKKWQVFQFMPIGPRGKISAEQFVISDEEFYQVKENILNKYKVNFDIVFKGNRDRSYNYMLVSSSGDAYKVDIEDKSTVFGNLNDLKSWDNIIKNL